MSAEPHAANPVVKRPKLRPKKCVKRTTKIKLRQPMMGSNMGAPDTVTGRAATREKRDIRMLSESPSSSSAHSTLLAINAEPIEAMMPFLR
jgi:hypothetical protein